MAIMLKRVLHWVEALGAAMAQDELGYWLTRQSRTPTAEPARDYVQRAARRRVADRGDGVPSATVFDVSVREDGKSFERPDRHS